MGRVSTARESLPQATRGLRPSAAGSAVAGSVTIADVEVPETGRVALHGHG
jgi:hypothetical protein